MNAAQFSSALGKVNDKYIMEAITYERKKKSGWLKWGAMAACFGLIFTVAMAALPGILKGSNKIPTPDPGPAVSDLVPLFYYMKEINLEAREIVAPRLFDENEMPVITKEELKSDIENNTTVQGTVTALNSVCVQDSDTAWYLTTMTIAVEEVLNGSAASEVHIVCASSYSGMLDSNLVPAPGISGCYEGMRSVFVLRDIYAGPWMIAGAEIYPTSLGEYFVMYQLNRDENTLIFVDQNITVSLDEICVLPNKGNVPTEYPDTIIVPGFDLDEPNEPVESQNK